MPRITLDQWIWAQHNIQDPDNIQIEGYSSEHNEGFLCIKRGDAITGVTHPAFMAGPDENARHVVYRGSELRHRANSASPSKPGTTSRVGPIEKLGREGHQLSGRQGNATLAAGFGCQENYTNTIYMAAVVDSNKQ